MNDTVTAFVLARDRDSATIARALRGAGYRVVDPRELVGIDPVTALGDCDVAVLGPGWAREEGHERVYDAILTNDVPQMLVRDLVPSWAAA